MGIVYLKNHPHREKLIAIAQQTLFYGVSVVDLDKEDLLMMIGSLEENKAREEEFRREKREFYIFFGKTR